MRPIVKILTVLIIFGVHFAELRPKGQEFLRVYKVFWMRFAAAQNTYIPNGFPRFPKVVKWRCEIVKILMVFVVFFTSFSGFILKWVIFHSVYNVSLTHFCVVAKHCFPNGFSRFAKVAKTYHVTLIILMLFKLYWCHFPGNGSRIILLPQS